MTRIAQLCPLLTGMFVAEVQQTGRRQPGMHVQHGSQHMTFCQCMTGTCTAVEPCADQHVGGCIFTRDTNDSLEQLPAMHVDTGMDYEQVASSA